MMISEMAREIGGAAKEGDTSPEVKSCIPEEGCCRGKMAGRHMIRITLHIANNLFNPA